MVSWGRDRGNLHPTSRLYAMLDMDGQGHRLHASSHREKGGGLNCSALLPQDGRRSPVPFENRFRLPYLSSLRFHQEDTEVLTYKYTGTSHRHVHSMGILLCSKIFVGKKKNLSVWKKDLHLQIDLQADPTGRTLPFANPLETSGLLSSPEILIQMDNPEFIVWTWFKDETEMLK